MSYLIFIHGAAIPRATPHDNRYVREYDPNVGKHGRLRTTPNKAEALRFASVDDAGAVWRAVNATYPTRPDGLPNRPLTAFTVSIIHEGAEPLRDHLASAFHPDDWYE